MYVANIKIYYQHKKKKNGTCFFFFTSIINSLKNKSTFNYKLLVLYDLALFCNLFFYICNTFSFFWFLFL
ncbi:hypothetical protein PFTANZ_00920 [Plasmodium falciparum Tanzania (2000708)]|uniref:Uncharacterized protein n=2 Tax=Plasmodium falciparum TaxID=5833 RepID=A0A024WCC7_PLAFA|nr:hypothetical protein PFTANZ_00920 [Plasmodium falciparum Tanzania (2000708)]ETW44689.1 hypothetical protein PFNF135_00901 [Plasmodium falciparum NF135/5.C10]